MQHELMNRNHELKAGMEWIDVDDTDVRGQGHESLGVFRVARPGKQARCLGSQGRKFRTQLNSGKSLAIFIYDGLFRRRRKKEEQRPLSKSLVVDSPDK